MVQESQVALMQALASYLEAQKDKERQAMQVELNRFTRWCGRDRVATSLTPLEVEEYCGTLDEAGEEAGQRVVFLKGFLGYLSREGWTPDNLATHAKLRRAGKKALSSQRAQRRANASQLTADGYQRLQAELAALKGERGSRAEEIRKAAATRDFSENAPLDAAREHQGQAEARIRELEALLKGAVIMGEDLAKRNTDYRVSVGSRVVLKLAKSTQELSYVLVESSEADPSAGKISSVSPVGKAILGRTVGDEVEVITPRGVVRYVVAKVLR
ncbi:MAG: transcription elongation factor GreA [Chloroflexi bacterium]|nr:transcription elongation factor GreA [Chloroflexota bacterium]